MKIIFKILFIFCLTLSLPGNLLGQCAAGYSQAQLNWDNVSYYYNSGVNVAPYGKVGGNYVSNAMEQTQRFTIGTTDVRIALSAAGIVKGENGTNTGNLASYTGTDAYFTPTANGQNMTLTFTDTVRNVNFVIYDIDLQAVFTITARDYNNTAIPVSAVKNGGSVITVGGNNTNTVTVTATNTAVAVSSNNGSATVSVAGSAAGAVKSITVTFTTIGTNPEFWLSDINACMWPTFPVNYHQTVSPRPFTNSPDYFLITPDNNNVYMVDPTTGRAYWIFQDNTVAGAKWLNSFAYDATRHLLYYAIDGTATSETNRALKAYDFNTDTKITVLADVTSLNIPTYDNGMESAAAAFYNGDLYLGVEGGFYNTSITRETVIYKLTLDAAGIPIRAAQVMSFTAYDAVNDELHNWGDFLIKDGILYDWNSSRTGTGPYNYSKSSIMHYNLMTGAVTNLYMNPGTTAYAGQAGMDWAGNLYTTRNVISRYNLAGANVSPAIITSLRGPAWVGSSGDASEPFRPKVDFGDAPLSYDPVEVDAAVNEMDSALNLGGDYDREWVTRGQTVMANSDNYDDGLSFVPIYNPVTGAYLAQVNVFNNTGADATVGAWLDADGDGVFEAAEGSTLTVSTNPGVQQVWIYIPSLPAVLPNGAYTYLRLRIARGAEGMSVANARGWFRSGEVEDYRVPVDDFPLATQQMNFTASLTPLKTVRLNWDLNDETGMASYVVEKSYNGTDWSMLSGMTVNSGEGTAPYEVVDNSPSKGIIYYRIKMLRQDGTSKISTVRKIDYEVKGFTFTVAPNPARFNATVYISSETTGEQAGTLEVINAQGAVVFHETVRIKAGTTSVRLPVEAKLASGRYIIRVKAGTYSYSQSMIVNK